MTYVQVRFRARSVFAGSAFVMAVLLAGCSSYPDWANPVEWYRGVIGTSEDDPTGSEPNAKNLEAGNEEPYPNLGSVPAPPTDALSSAEREKLRQALIADRNHAEYVDNSDQYVAAAPQAVPGPVASPAASPEGTSVGSATPAAGNQTTSGSHTPLPTTAPGPPGDTNSPSVAAQHPQTAPRSHRLNQGTSPTEAQPPTPQESSLTPPTISDLPQGDQPRAAPPAPVTAAAPAASAPRQTAALPPPTPASPPPTPAPPPRAASPSASPPPTPASPPYAALPPAAPPQPVASAPVAPQGVSLTVAVVRFTGSSARISPDEMQQIRQAAQLRQQNGGIIRVTAYSQPSEARNPATAELAGFGLAMDRARAVAQALTQAGVPAHAVEVSATPAPLGEEGGVAALTLEY